MTRLLLWLALLGCTNAAGLDENECVTVREMTKDGRCFVLCAMSAATEATRVNAVACPTEATP